MESVVVVVANASDTFGLATESSERVRELGYVFVIRTDGLRELSETALYFVEGFENEAYRLARQLGMPSRLVEPRPEGALVEGNAPAELLLMLGNDWREVTNLDTPVNAR